MDIQAMIADDLERAVYEACEQQGLTDADALEIVKEGEAAQRAFLEEHDFETAAARGVYYEDIHGYMSRFDGAWDLGQS